jgi:hypothetical protein
LRCCKGKPPQKSNETPKDFSKTDIVDFSQEKSLNFIPVKAKGAVKLLPNEKTESLDTRR